MNRTVRRKLIFFSALAAALVLAAVFSRQLCPYDPSCQNYDAVLEAPSRAHPFGTDQFGRDMLSRVLAGAATSIFSALVLVGIISVAGTAIGVICGYSGKAVDGILMRISDICLAFPGLVFALAIAAVLNGGIGNAVLALAVVSWPKYARIARSQTLSVKSSDYIASARLAGSRPLQIIFRAYSAEYRGADSCYGSAGYRHNDDGNSGSFFSGTGSKAAHGGVGKYDEPGAEACFCCIPGWCSRRESEYLCRCRSLICWEMW